MKTILKFIILLAFLGLLSCNDNIYIDGKSMGTTYSIIFSDKNSIDKANIQKILDRFESIFSSWDSNSELSVINKADIGKWIKVSNDMKKLLSLSMLINKKTNGYFDITLGNTLKAWGHNEYFNNNKAKPSSITIKKTITGMQYLLIKNNSIKKTKNIKLDLSAIAKGYALDNLAEEFVKKGINNFSIELGGEVITKGKNNKEAWKIDIFNPYSTNKKTITLTNSAIATSGNYNNFVIFNNKKYGHIINPKTKYDNNDFTSVSVIAPSATIADAYATALMAMGGNGYKFAKDNNLSAFFIDKNNKIHSINFK